jgi:hypothetical protein
MLGATPESLGCSAILVPLVLRNELSQKMLKNAIAQLCIEKTVWKKV